MLKNALKLKKIICFIMIVVIMTITTPFKQVKKVEAVAYVPIIIQGVEIASGTYQTMSALNSLAGIDFPTEEEFRNNVIAAANHDMENFNRMLEICGAYDDYENNPVIQAGDVVNVNVGDLKEYFNYCKEFYSGVFAPAESGIGGTISPLNSSVGLHYYNGIPVVDYNSIPSGSSSAYQLADSASAQSTYLSKYVPMFNKYSGYMFQSVTNGPFGFDVWKSSYGTRKYEYYMRDNYKGVNHSMVASTGVLTVEDGGYEIYNFMNGMMFVVDGAGRLCVSNISVRLNQFWNSGAGALRLEAGFTKGNCLVIDYISNLKDFAKTDFTAAVDGNANIMQDTPDYAKTMAAIEDIRAQVAALAGVIPQPLTDEDYIVVKVPSVPTDLTREAVIAYPLPVSGEDDDDKDVPKVPDVPIDIPDIPAIDIPVVENPDVPFEWSLSGFLDAIIQWLTAIWNGIISLPSRLLDGLKELFLWLINALKALLVALFVPSEGYLKDEFEKFKDSLAPKLPYEKYVSVIKSMENISGGSNNGFEDYSFVLWGTTYTLRWSETINNFLPTIRNWIRGLFYLITAYFYYRQIMYIVRGTTYSSIGNAHSNKDNDK